MQSLAAALEAIINGHTAALHTIPEDKILYKPSPARWSKKEIIGPHD
ncbi:MAG: hypothetical protein WDO16_24610 [Bacteroidota bacterium]